MSPRPVAEDPNQPLWLALCKRLGIDPEQVLFGSMKAETGQGDGTQVRISWEGVAMLSADEFDEILAESNVDRA